MVMTVLALALFSSLVAVVHASADASCPTGFTPVTTSEAAAIDPGLTMADVNGNGWLCRMDLMAADGTVFVPFGDDLAAPRDPPPPPGSCPPGFTGPIPPFPPVIGTHPDNNGDGLVCEKSIFNNGGLRVVVIDNNVGGPP